jgi:Holliday junction resolvase RusA-like endonuclease
MAAVTPQTFTLPWPVGSNALWRAVNGRNILSKRARLWVEAAKKELMAQHPVPIPGPVEVRFEFCGPTKQPYDLDGRQKAPLDLLVKLGIIRNDNNKVVKRIVAEEGEGFVGARITVTPWEPVAKEIGRGGASASSAAASAGVTSRSCRRAQANT